MTGSFGSGPSLTAVWPPPQGLSFRNWTTTAGSDKSIQVHALTCPVRPSRSVGLSPGPSVSRCRLAQPVRSLILFRHTLACPARRSVVSPGLSPGLSSGLSSGLVGTLTNPLTSPTVTGHAGTRSLARSLARSPYRSVEWRGQGHHPLPLQHSSPRCIRCGDQWTAV